MSSDTKTKSRNAQKGSSSRGWLIPIIVIIVVGAAAVIAIVATTSDDDDEPETQALDDLTPEELADSGEFGEVDIAGAPLQPFEGNPSVGVETATFTTDTLDGARVTVEASDSTKVIGFFVHSCQFCQREVSRLAGWLRTNELPEGVELVTVNTLSSPERDNWPPSDWYFAEGYPEPVLLDDATGTISSYYGMTTFPYWVVVDEDMRVITQASGELSDEGFEQLLAVAAANPAS